MGQNTASKIIFTLFSIVMISLMVFLLVLAGYFMCVGEPTMEGTANSFRALMGSGAALAIFMLSMFFWPW